MVASPKKVSEDLASECVQIALIGGPDCDTTSKKGGLFFPIQSGLERISIITAQLSLLFEFHSLFLGVPEN